MVHPTTKDLLEEAADHLPTDASVEEVFFHAPVLLAEDAKHSTREPRYLVLGRTAAERIAAERRASA